MFRKAKTTGEKNKYLCFTACVLIAISIFPPYLLAVGPGETLAKSLTGSRDWIYVLAIAGAAAIFTAAGMYLPVVTLGIAGLAVFFSENNTTAAELGREIERLANYQIVNGPGRYVLLLGAGTLILFALIGIFIPGEKKTGASQNTGGRMSLRQLLADLTVEEEAQPEAAGGDGSGGPARKDDSEQKDDSARKEDTVQREDSGQKDDSDQKEKGKKAP